MSSRKINEDFHSKEKNNIVVSMAIVPLLKGEVTSAIKRDFKEAKMRSYSNAERDTTNRRIAELLKQRENDKEFKCQI